MDEAMLKSGQYPNIAIEAGTDPAEVMREHGQVIPDGEKYELADSREKLEVDALNFANGFIRKHNGAISWNDELYQGIIELLDRQAAITERKCMKQATTRYIGWDCAECAEGLGKELDARCDPLKERIAELTAERDQLSRDLDAEHALVVQFEHDNEELRHANNTLRASVAGLKMTVERFKARESRDTRQSG